MFQLKENIMDDTNFWKSQSHPSKLTALMFLIPLACLLGVIFSEAFMETHTLSIVFGALIGVSLIGIIIACFALKWHWPQTFKLDENGLYFYSEKNPASWFFCPYGNIKGYAVKEEKNGLVTVKVEFINKEDAGFFGKLQSLKMIKVENPAQMKAVFEAHGVGNL